MLFFLETDIAVTTSFSALALLMWSGLDGHPDVVDLVCLRFFWNIAYLGFQLYSSSS